MNSSEYPVLIWLRSSKFWLRSRSILPNVHVLLQVSGEDDMGLMGATADDDEHDYVSRILEHDILDGMASGYFWQ